MTRILRNKINVRNNGAVKNIWICECKQHTQTLCWQHEPNYAFLSAIGSDPIESSDRWASKFDGQHFGNGGGPCGDLYLRCHWCSFRSYAETPSASPPDHLPTCPCMLALTYLSIYASIHSPTYSSAMVCFPSKVVTGRSGVGVATPDVVTRFWATMFLPCSVLLVQTWIAKTSKRNGVTIWLYQL